MDQTELQAKILANWEGHITHPRWIDDDLWGITPFIFTTAIIGDVDTWGYRIRYCYHSEADAVARLYAWDGTGEPTGWHRALIQGQPIRKTDDQGNIYTEAD